LTTRPCRLAVTPGEPAGIGPDICLALARQATSRPTSADIVFIADPDLLRQRATELGYNVTINRIDAPNSLPACRPDVLNVIAVKSNTATQAGKLNPANAGYVVEALNRACDLLLDGHFDALVTGPVHKGVINQAGIPFTGHTEWLADKTGGSQPVMMLANGNLRVALATTHLPLTQVSQAITHKHLETIIRVLHSDLRHRFHIAAPRIRICGLNPHAGEDGHLGREEVDTMIPLIDMLRRQGMQLEGPVPADTAFLPEQLDQADAILAMYHDQGLPVLKYSGFETAVNVTLGLPIIRTSVDHGTALELAATGRANPHSLIAAVNMAIEMCSGTIGSGSHE